MPQASRPPWRRGRGDEQFWARGSPSEGRWDEPRAGLRSARVSTRAASAIRENTRKTRSGRLGYRVRCWASAWDTTRRPTKADPGGGKEAGGCRVRAQPQDRGARTARTADAQLRTPRHRYRMRRWTRSSHQTKPTFGGTDDWNPIPTTHSRCHSALGRRSKTHILKLSIKPPTAMQKAPVRTSSSESFGSFILRRATRTDARVRSSGYKQAHEKRM